VRLKPNFVQVLARGLGPPVTEDEQQKRRNRADGNRDPEPGLGRRLRSRAISPASGIEAIETMTNTQYAISAISNPSPHHSAEAAGTRSQRDQLPGVQGW
jgi:hypothetical protein